MKRLNAVWHWRVFYPPTLLCGLAFLVCRCHSIDSISPGFPITRECWKERNTKKTGEPPRPMASAPIPRPSSARFAALFQVRDRYKRSNLFNFYFVFLFCFHFFVSSFRSIPSFDFDWLLREKSQKNQFSVVGLGGNICPAADPHKSRISSSSTLIISSIGAYIFERQKPWKSFDSAPLLSLTCFSPFVIFVWNFSFIRSLFVRSFFLLSPLPLRSSQSINGECV